MKIEKILAGIDFEKDTEKVLAYASYFAQTFSASLKVIHVIDYLTTPPEYLAPYVKEEQLLVEREFDLLRKRIEASGMKVETEVVVGRLRESFDTAIRTAKADMLVLGFVSHVLRRSSSEKLIKGLLTPMLVVRGGRANLSNAGSLKIAKILCSTDFSDISERAVRTALELADKLSARLEILHVFPRDLFAQMKALEERDNILRIMYTEAKDKLKKAVQDSGVTSAGLLEDGEPYKKIVSVAKENDFDLIVMGARGLGRIEGMLIGSVTDAVLKSSPCPVLVVH